MYRTSPILPPVPTLTPARGGVHILALLLAGIVSACSGATEVPRDELVRQGEIFLDPGTMEPFSGFAFATYESRAGVTTMGLGGAYAGPFDALFADRRLSSKESYQDGVKHGPYEWFFESGQLFEEGSYADGRLEGPYRAYWETGELYEEGTYRSGQFDGPRRWYMNSRLVELVTYRLGMIEGLYERYSPEGDLELKGLLYEGNPCGTWIEGNGPAVYPACGSRITE